jgi:hypothetical protein
MRLACVMLILAFVGCGSSGLSNADLSSHDQARADFSRVDQAGADLSGSDLGHMCYSSGMCTQPNCGSNCCSAGEWCDNGTCRCGEAPACTDGNSCVSGVIMVGNNACGSICCGATAACPG